MKLILALISITFLKVLCTNLNHRITGGKLADIKDFQHQLSLLLRTTEGLRISKFIASASIVSRQWAITSAQCIYFIDITLIQQKLVILRGGTSRWHYSQNATDHKIVRREIHPQFDDITYDYDLALLKVEKPFDGHNERPIKVAGGNFKIPYEANVVISGWGEVGTVFVRPESHLRVAFLKIVEDEDCQEVYKFAEHVKVTKRMLCAWENGVDACSYDTGGPLVYNTILIGVVSWGLGCSSKVYPGIYSRITEFYSWIRNFEKEHKINLNITFVNKAPKAKPLLRRNANDKKKLLLQGKH